MFIYMSLEKISMLEQVPDGFRSKYAKFSLIRLSHLFQ